MILYISHYEHDKKIEQAIIDSNKRILNSFVTDKMDLQGFVKKEFEQLQVVQKMIIDLEALENSEEDILQAISNFRMLYNAELIIISTQLQAGDKLLHDIFSLGIYNIITEEETLIKELIDCLTIGKKYSDSIKYKMDESQSKTESSKKVETITKEKVIIKSRIEKIVNKELIGFAGTQSRIGTTHNAITCARFLQNKGFKVALIENVTNTRCFNEIKDVYAEDIQLSLESYFTLYQIDFFPEFDLENLHLVLNSSYNFIIIDFGIFGDSIAIEFSRCAVPIIVAGWKAWELDYINKVFLRFDFNINILNQFCYLFNFTSDSCKEEIYCNLENLEKIYVQDYMPDLFNDTSHVFTDMLSCYMPEENVEIEQKKKSVLSMIGGILNRHT